MPWLDIGDLPTTYTPKKAEGWQVFMNPQSKVPHSLVVEYREWNKQYDCSRAKSMYDQFLFETKGITMSDIEETLRQATLFVKPYLGRFAMIDKIKNIVLGVSFVFVCVYSYWNGFRKLWCCCWSYDFLHSRMFWSILGSAFCKPQTF